MIENRHSLRMPVFFFGAERIVFPEILARIALVFGQKLGFLCGVLFFVSSGWPLYSRIWALGFTKQVPPG